MPVIVRPGGVCPAIFDPPSRGIRGIPLAYFVRPVVRHGGIGSDIPKGFELPGCMVDPCCLEPGVLEFGTFTTAERLDCSDTTVEYTITITNTGDVPLTNLTLTPIDLAIAGYPILSGDVSIVLPVTPTLLAGGTITLTATTTYTVPGLGPTITTEIVAAAGILSSDQATNIIGLSTFVDLCGIVS